MFRSSSMNNTNKATLLGRAVIPLCFLSATTAEAADGKVSDVVGSQRISVASGSKSDLDIGNDVDIVVTARKRAESLFDVPLAVTAISSTRLENLQIHGLEDLAQFTPGFYFTSLTNGRADRSTTNLRFRGMATSGVNSPDQDLATLFIDGTPVVGGSPPPIEDVDHVEVIRGPQSAAFGRATFAGAVNYVTRDPGSQWKGHVNGELAAYGTTDISGSVEGGLIGDKLTFRLFARDFRTDGQYVNHANTDRLGAQSTDEFSATLVARPTDSLTVKGRFSYRRDKDGPSAAIQYGATTRGNCQLGPTLQPYFCGKVAFPPASLIGYDTAITALTREQLIENKANFIVPFKPSDLIDGFGYGRKAYSSSLSANYVFGSGTSLSFIGAYHHDDNISFDGAGRDSAMFPDNPFGSFPVKQVWQYYGELSYADYSAEARLSSSSDQRIRWLIGANYLHSNTVNGNAFFSPFGYAQFPDSLPLRSKPTTTGIFGSIDIDLLKELTLSLEGRYQWDDIRQQATGGMPLRAKYKTFLPRAILSYKPIQSLNVYMSYAKGNRPGFFNSSISTLTQAQAQSITAQTGATLAEPESKLDDFEVGIKGNLFGDQVQFSADAYYMVWSNQRAAEIGRIQNPGANPPYFDVQVQTAVGRTNLMGVELEGAFKLTQSLRLSTTFDWAGSKIKSFDCMPCQAIIGTTNVNGNRTPRVPEFTGSAVLDYDRPLNGRSPLNIFGSLEYIYSGTKFADETNLVETGASNKFNIRFGIRNKDTWRLELYVRNLTNDKTIENLAKYIDLYDSVGGTAAISLALPQKRTVGARLSYHF